MSEKEGDGIDDSFPYYIVLLKHSEVKAQNKYISLSILYSSSQTDFTQKANEIAKNFPYYIVLLKPSLLANFY